MLTTAYRNIESNIEITTEGVNFDLSTPILDKEEPFSVANSADNTLLPVSEAWILSGTLPKMYVKSTTIPKSASSGSTGSGSNLASAAFMSKLLSTVSL